MPWRRLLARLDSRNRRRIAGALLCIHQEARPSVGPDDLHRIGKLAARITLFGMGHSRGRSLRSAAKFRHDRIVRSRPKKCSAKLAGSSLPPRDQAVITSVNRDSDRASSCLSAHARTARGRDAIAL